MKAVLLALVLGLGASLPAAVPYHDLDETLQALRNQDKAEALKALQAVREMDRFPSGKAQRLLPALLWLSDDEDADVSNEARSLVKDLGWPKLACLECLRNFASRQDKVYQMMAVSGLKKLAFEDPEALALLLDLTHSGNRDIARIAANTAKAMGGQRCPDKGIEPGAWDPWNTQARAIFGRLQLAIGSCDGRARPLLQLLQKCPNLEPSLQREAASALERLK